MMRIQNTSFGHLLIIRFDALPKKGTTISNLNFLKQEHFVDKNFRQLLTINSQNVGSGFIIKPSTMVWMGQHQKFDFIAKDFDFEKNRLCTGSSIIEITF